MSKKTDQKEMIVYDFSNLDLEENSTNNCFGFLDDDDDCDGCDYYGG